MFVYTIDVDECLSEEDDCHEFANCTNTIGSFICNCSDGFEGNGTICTGILCGNIIAFGNDY